ncbi:hypothetical protein [Mesorhizobium sp. M0909]|uniref:hypothetical protein n=1 Tax=Mesorhizobium sp. M0909 TaxID=2957024 RepID=UPI0033366D72
MAQAGLARGPEVIAVFETELTRSPVGYVANDAELALDARSHGDGAYRDVLCLMHH